MSNHCHGFYEHHLSEWASVGVETAEGSRDFNAGEEPTSAEFDYILDQLFKSVDGLASVIHDYIMPQRFGAEELYLVGADAGSYDSIETADSRRLAVLKLAAGSYEQCRIVGVVVKNNALSTPEVTKVRIVWSTAATIAKTAEWVVKYKAVATGASYTAGAFSEVTAEAADSAIAHGKVVTEISLPVLARGSDLLLEIGHQGDIDDITNDICVHRVEVI